MGLFEERRWIRKKLLIEDSARRRARRRVIEQNLIVTNRGFKHQITLSFNMSYMSKSSPTLSGGRPLEGTRII